MAKVKDSVVFDQGPPERRQHNKVVIERGANHRARLRIVDQTEIDRLLLERKISLDQHTAAEHLFRDVTACGYMPACKWAMDSNIRGAAQSVSQNRANVLIRMGLSMAWMNARVGKGPTQFMVGVILGERKVPDPAVPMVQRVLDCYQSFEGWWHGKDPQAPLPSLLAELPGDVQRTRPFLNE